SALDSVVLDALAHTPSSSRTPLPQLIQQYLERAGHVLDAQLPYEPTPPADRAVVFDSPSGDGGICLVAHVAREGDRSKITVSSGFAVAPRDGQPVVLTCAHTLEEIRWSPLLVLPVHNPSSPLAPPDLPHARSSGTLLLVPSAAKDNERPPLSAHPVSAVLSSLHRSDLLLLGCPAPTPLAPLPVSPYPAQPGTRIRAHFVSEAPQEGWRPWVGGMYAKWVEGTVLGYRDFAGREAVPGTYDALSHMLFHPPPLAGSSGGPIVDEKTGAVVGVMLGTRMDNRVEGVRGWGVPAEAIYEMFSLPGLKLNK
ncbi:hypothetical protein BV25DRAFT_1784910, partial [Artomyces pyxidatus]